MGRSPPAGVAAPSEEQAATASMTVAEAAKAQGRPKRRALWLETVVILGIAERAPP